MDKKIKLNVKNRLLLPELLPKKDSMVTMLVVKGILDKINFTTSEQKKFGFSNDNGRIVWKNDISKDFSFTDTELKVIKDAIKGLDDKKEVSLDMLDLVGLF